jgi:hypothetical protein
VELVKRVERKAVRSIQISVETFAAIWKAQEPGETSEDAILRRVLKVPEVAPRNMERDTMESDFKVVEGYVDPRYNVVIEPGFEIYRVYHGKKYVARALQGLWMLDGVGDFKTLSAMSTALGIANENAWANWFWDDNGKRRPLSDKRDQAKIVRRAK